MPIPLDNTHLSIENGHSSNGHSLREARVSVSSREARNSVSSREARNSVSSREARNSVSSREARNSVSSREARNSVSSREARNSVSGIYTAIQSKRFLLIDDAVINRNATKRQLLQAGAKSAVPVDTAEAAALLSENRPLHQMFDVILMDWFTPNVNGVPLSRLLSDTYNGTELHIFLLKENADPNTSADGLRILSKPINLDSLNHFCSIPASSLWELLPAQPVHEPMQQMVPGSPSNNFSIDEWLQTHREQIQQQRTTMAPLITGSPVNGWHPDDQDTLSQGSSNGGKKGKQFRHAHPHEEPHGVTFGMDHDQLSVAEQNMMLFAAFCFFVAAISCFGVYALETRKDEPKHVELYVATTCVAMIAFCAYLAKSIGQGYLTVNSITICHVRYMDWFFTTPLMLFDLCSLAGAGTGSAIFMIIVDCLMIAFGVIAMCSSLWQHKVIWYFVSCVFYGFLLFAVFGPLSKSVESQSDEVQDLFSTLKWVTVITWTLYPIVTLNGPNGISVRHDNTVGYFSHHTEAIFIVFLDIVSKIAFEAIILFSKI
eukprot:g6489.t1